MYRIVSKNKLLTKGVLLCIFFVVAIGGGGWYSWHRGAIDRELEELLMQPGVLAKLEGDLKIGLLNDTVNKTTPLLSQAIKFAQYLDPPKPVDLDCTISKSPNLIKQKPVAKPKISRPRFKLLVTSVHNHDSNQSMALIHEVGAKTRWVRVGERAGHQVVDSILKGKLVMRNHFNDKYDEVVIWREPKPVYKVAKKKDVSKTFRGLDGIARLRFEKKD